MLKIIFKKKSSLQYLFPFRRYMSNETLFNDFVAVARTFPSSYSTMGVNAVVMAMRLVREECNDLLTAKMTTSISQMMPEAVTIVGGEIKRDDIHLLLKYERGGYRVHILV